MGNKANQVEQQPQRGKIFVETVYICFITSSVAAKSNKTMVKEMSPRWGYSKYRRIVYYKDFAPKGALGGYRTILPDNTGGSGKNNIFAQYSVFHVRKSEKTTDLNYKRRRR